MKVKNNAKYIKYTAVIPRNAWDIYQEARPSDAIYDLLVELFFQWRIPANAIPAYPDTLAGIEVSIDQVGVTLRGHLLCEPDLLKHLDASDNLVLVPGPDWVPVLSLTVTQQ